jgi:hypothetical protein
MTLEGAVSGTAASAGAASTTLAATTIPVRIRAIFFKTRFSFATAPATLAQREHRVRTAKRDEGGRAGTHGPKPAR